VLARLASFAYWPDWSTAGPFYLADMRSFVDQLAARQLGQAWKIVNHARGKLDTPTKNCILRAKYRADCLASVVLYAPKWIRQEVSCCI